MNAVFCSPQRKVRRRTIIISIVIPAKAGTIINIEDPDVSEINCKGQEGPGAGYHRPCIWT